ncbi:trypsin-like peptidase domain-containing protein [Streptomyces sp. NPDC051907]|uniref:S1C family serine protease n=1 Tax=Streptomyces sp. NPDC051907 TaxID=3155284 RepID=UPI00341D8019
MSTENEGNEVPAAPSAPPVPVAAPEGMPASAPSEPQRPHGAQEPAAAAAERPGHSPQPEPATAPLPPAAPASAPAAEAPTAVQPAYAESAPHPPGATGATGGAGSGWPPPPAAFPSYGGGAGSHAGDAYGGDAGAHGGGGGPVWGAPAPVAQPPRKRSGGLVAAVLVAALVAGGVGGGIGYWAAERNDAVDSTTIAAADAPRDLKREPGTVAAVAGKALPSVVTIEAKSGGDGESDSSVEGGTGTGFVYDKQGHILTNNHVVASAADGGTLFATFSNGKRYDAEVVGRAHGYDVAVLKLKNAPSGLTPLPLGNSERVAVGDSTIAIGAPFGLSNTVTTGIISAKNRPVASGDGSSGKNSYMSALQTDASINPGNSGGPLLDSTGAVIGINSAIQSAGSGLGQSQAGSIGLGFAIPINQAKNVAQQLIKTGQPVYPVIGATVDMTGKDAGAKIASEGAGGTEPVSPNGPAAKAGLKAGDLITRFDGKPIDSGPTLISEIWNHKAGDKITLTYERGGSEHTAQVVLGERQGDS